MFNLILIMPAKDRKFVQLETFVAQMLSTDNASGDTLSEAPSQRLTNGLFTIAPAVSVNLEARQLVQEKRISQAIDLLQRGLIEYPDNITLMVRLAKTYAATSDFKTAKRILKRAHEIDPTSKEPYIAQASISLKQGQFGQAKYALHNAQAIDPEDGRTLMLMGIISIISNKYNAAKIFLEHAAEIDPDNSKIRSKLNMVNNRIRRDIEKFGPSKPQSAEPQL